MWTGVAIETEIFQFLIKYYYSIKLYSLRPKLVASFKQMILRYCFYFIFLNFILLRYQSITFTLQITMKHSYFYHIRTPKHKL